MRVTGAMNGLSVGGKYTPSSTIKTEPLTSKYTIQGDIGRGKFAVVRKCVDLATGETVAAKVIRKRRKGKSCREEILREVVMLEYAMAHPRLVSLREVFETPSELILVTEFCSGGELFHECVIEESFEEKDVVQLMVQILEGLCFLHENNIVHLDLKPQNILLTEPFPRGSIKICDLGFACLTNTGEDIRDIIGTPDYVAPEVLDYEPLSIQTDMWSLGVLAYVMLTACSPFAGDNQQETFCNITQVKLDFPDDLFSHISPQAQDFISKLLVKDPRRRLTARQCLDHPWLKAAGAEMHVSLPADNKAAALAQDMVPPSNWNPDRRNSIGRSPTFHATPVDSGAQEAGSSNGDKGGGVSDTPPPPPPSTTPASSGEVSRTMEDIGIDVSCFAGMDAHLMDVGTAGSKWQSMEVPVKKAKCAPREETPAWDSAEQEEGGTASVANGGSISMDMKDLTVTAAAATVDNSDTTAVARPPPSADCINQPGL